MNQVSKDAAPWIAELQGQGDHPPLSVEEEEQPLLEETNRRIREETDKRIRDLKNDNDINLTENVAYRNALIKQEEISGVMAEIINERGISVTDPGDIRKGVDIFLTEVMDKYGEPRRRGLNKILADLAENRGSGQYFDSIMEEIEDLDDPCGKKNRRMILSKR